MKYIFYVDIFFITNFIMDILLLSFTEKLCRKKVSVTSKLLGAFLGALLISLDMLYPLGNGLFNKIYRYFVISFLMCVIAFRVRIGRELWKLWVCLFFTAFFVGGLMNAAYFYLGISSVTFLYFLGLAGVSFWGMKQLQLQIQAWTGKTGTTDDIIEVLICHKGVEIRVQALYDSGNSLTEPYSRKPVHIIEQHIAYEILKEGSIANEKIRIVPYHSLGGDNGILTVFECERLILMVRGENVNTGSAYLGIYKGKLTESGRYNMILNRSINKWL